MGAARPLQAAKRPPFKRIPCGGSEGKPLDIARESVSLRNAVGIPESFSPLKPRAVELEDGLVKVNQDGYVNVGWLAPAAPHWGNSTKGAGGNGPPDVCKGAFS